MIRMDWVIMLVEYENNLRYFKRKIIYYISENGFISIISFILLFEVTAGNYE